MKRQMELIRKILGHIEEKGSRQPMSDIEIPGYENDEVEYHLLIMSEANLIKADFTLMTDGREKLHYVYRLTWEGHEFLDASKNTNVWRKVKSQINEKGMDVPFEVFKGILMVAVKSFLMEG